MIDFVILVLLIIDLGLLMLAAVWLALWMVGGVLRILTADANAVLDSLAEAVLPVGEWAWGVVAVPVRWIARR